MERIRFSLNLSADEFLYYYRGQAQAVSVVAQDGRRVQIPASSLRPFVERNGVTGQFEMVLGENHKLLRIERISREA